MKKLSKFIGNSILICTLFILLFSSCKPQDYEMLRKTELEKGINVDSVIYGVHLGMKFENFFNYCFTLNLQGKFKPNQSGNMVTVDLKDGFNFPVYFEFFPVIPDTSNIIYSYVGTIGYKNYSQYNKEYSIENLLKEALDYFEKNYKGNDFITVPNDNILLKYKYIKIDGNRQIIVEPTFVGQNLNVRFDDLNHIEVNGKK